MRGLVPSYLAFILTAVTVRAGSPQTIIFPNIPGKKTTDAPFAMTATASSGLTVQYSIVSASGVATLAGDTLTLSGASGTVTVRASQSGNSTFDAALSVYRSFSVRQGNFSMMAQGSSASHRLGIKSDGTLWAWGSNSAGQVGNGSVVDVFSPLQITAQTNWTASSVGGEISAAIRAGTLWTWGRNSSGQLGLGDFTNRSSPTQVGSLTTWTHVAAGNTFMVARQSNGTVWAWGSNTSGQLGLGDTTARNSPVQIGTGTNWSSVAAGSDHVMAQQTNGTLWAWGLNSSSQLGDGTTALRSAPVQIGILTTWNKVACGGTSSYALKSDGTLWAWGANNIGQLGVGDAASRSSPTQVGMLTTWAEIGAGNVHAIALQSDGSIWSWGGSGNVGATAQGSNSTFTSPRRVGSENDWAGVAGGTSYCIVLKTDGTIWAAGVQTNGRLGYPTSNLRPMVGGGIRALAQGPSTTHFILNNGTMWGVGQNTGGVLGDGTSTPRRQPSQIGTATNWKDIAVGNNHSLALRADGSMWASGNGASGQIGDGAAATRFSFVQIGSSQWKSIGAGGSHNVAVRADGTLWGWGSNTSGQVGDGSTTQRNSPVQIGTDSDWSFAGCGDSCSFAIKTTGTLWAWGSNTSGQLGDGTTTQRTSPVQVGAASNWSKVSSGLAHTQAIQANGTLWAWGSNASGKLGDGTGVQQNSPVQIGSGTDWTMVQALSQHTIALRANGSTWVCGANNTSQLGTNDSASRSSFIQFGTHNAWVLLGNGRGLSTFAVTADGTLWGTGANSDYQVSDSQRVWSLLEPVHPTIATQAVAFPSVTVPTYNSPVTLAASASSGLPITYFVSGPASINGNQLTVSGPGEVKLLAYQGGDRPAWHDTATAQAIVMAAPHVQAGPVTGITATSATLNATVSAAGQTTSCLFEYDTDLTDGTYSFSTSGTPGPLLGYSQAPVSALINGLAGGKLYHYRLTASNAAGSTTVVGTFSTLQTVFQQWAASKDLQGNAASLTADGDGDGLGNLLEWAFDLDPNTASTLNASIAKVGSVMEYVYSRSVPAASAGVTFSVEWSDSLAASDWSSVGVTQSVEADNGSLQQIKAIVPTGGANSRFVRLKVSQP